MKLTFLLYINEKLHLKMCYAQCHSAKNYEKH